MKESIDLRAKLEAAVMALDAVEDLLDVSTAVCTCCGHDKHNAHDDFETAREIQTARGKLEKRLRSLERNEWKGRTLLPFTDAEHAR